MSPPPISNQFNEYKLPVEQQQSSALMRIWSCPLAGGSGACGHSQLHFQKTVEPSQNLAP